MKTNTFDEDLEYGLVCEEKVQERFKQFMQPVIHRIYYNQNPQLQRKGIDAVITPEQISIDVKCRRYSSYVYTKGNDILIETISVIETNKPGWARYTESSSILYMWTNKTEKKFIDGYIILDWNEFYMWFLDNEYKFEIKNAESYDKRTGDVWHTQNKVVIVKDIPKHLILRFNKSLFFENEQNTLSKYF